MIYRQLFDRESSTYTYLLADRETGEAILIDPVDGQAERDARVIDELGLTLRYSLETHVHADHVTASGKHREAVGVKTVVSAKTGVECADVLVSEGDRLAFGRYEVEVIETPGHTAGCVTYVVRDGAATYAFTGDALLVRGCGRTDFQQGDADTLFDSVRTKLFELPGDTFVCPAHDYRGHTRSTVDEEKHFNPRLRLDRTRAEFVAIMDGLELNDPKLMDVAVPANMACGTDASAPTPAAKSA